MLRIVLLVDLWKAIGSALNKIVQNKENEHSGVDMTPSIFSKKIISNQATQFYKFNRLVSLFLDSLKILYEC